MKDPLDKLFHLIFTPLYLSGNTLHSRNKETQHYQKTVIHNLGCARESHGKIFLNEWCPAHHRPSHSFDFLSCRRACSQWTMESGFKPKSFCPKDLPHPLKQDLQVWRTGTEGVESWYRREAGAGSGADRRRERSLCVPPREWRLSAPPSPSTQDARSSVHRTTSYRAPRADTRC